jgi:hypothetical protein
MTEYYSKMTGHCSKITVHCSKIVDSITTRLSQCRHPRRSVGWARRVGGLDMWRGCGVSGVRDWIGWLVLVIGPLDSSPRVIYSVCIREVKLHVYMFNFQE